MAEGIDGRVHAQEIEIGTVDLEHLLADALDESLGGTADGGLENLFRRSVLMDIAARHEEDAGAHVTGEFHLMGDDEHGHTIPCQLADDAEHFAHHRGIQGRCGLVEEDDFRLHGQGAGDGYTLFLPAGKTPRKDAGLFGQSHLAQERHGLFTCFLRCFSVQLAGGHHDILQYRLMGKEVESLENHPHPLAQQVDGIAFGKDVLAIEEDLSAGGRVQQVEGAQKRALPRPRRADDGDDLTAVDIGIDVAQHLKAAIVLPQMGDADEGCTGGGRFGPGNGRNPCERPAAKDDPDSGGACEKDGP